MIINLSRIDDRLIHGQVTTVWAKEARAERIIICDDEVANDEIRKTLLKQAAPPGIKVNVVDVDKAIRVYNNPKYDKVTAFLLFTNPTAVLRMIKGGVDIKSVNIGGMAFRHGKQQLTKAVSVDADDVEAFRELNNLNVELDYRVVKTDPKSNFIDIIEKEYRI